MAALLSVFGAWACSGSGNGTANGAPPQPVVTSVAPTANSNAVATTDPVSATFDDTMNVGSSGTFVVQGYQTGKYLGTYSGGGSTSLSLDPASSFRVGEEIEVSLTGALTSMDGATLETPFVFRFRVEAVGGTGVFADVQTVSNQLNAIALAAGDWDKDGDMDLAVANFGSNDVTILDNDSTGSFLESSTVANQQGATVLAAGDWDGDGDLDLAVANFGSNSVAILENDGTGLFSVSREVPNQQGAKGLTVGDWDGDGDLDLAVANFGANSVAILANDGTGLFTAASAVAVQQGATALASGDWDGDGDLDLAVANFGTDSIGILENDGTGLFTVSTTVANQVGVKALASGDWDGDGDLDLAAANFSGKGDAPVFMR
jgi:hypothetical protein